MMAIGFPILMAMILELSIQTLSAQPEGMEVSTTTPTNITGPGGVIPSLSTPGEKTFYVFTAEVEGVDEEKLKIVGDPYNVDTLVANKGDKVNIKFYNVDDVRTERHSFTIGDPYKVDVDLGFAENGNATFTSTQAGV